MEMKEQQSAPEASHPEHTAAPLPDEAASAPANGAAEETLSVVADLSPEELQEQLLEQRRKSEEYLDHLQRLQADFNNYRRRANQEKLQAASRGKEDVLRALIPVLANLHLALQHAQEDANAVRQGVQMIWQQFEGFLRDQGVERIATVGQPFDPAKHEALSTAPATADTPGNTIVAEINPGYVFDDRLLRPAQVVVARPEERAPDADHATPHTALDIEA
jgi:molecular chaperone GrpE